MSGKNAKERTLDGLNLYLYDESDTDGAWQMPIIHKTDFVPGNIVSIRYINKANPEDGIHCFAYDNELDRIWKEPDKWLEKLRGHSCFFSPDYSLYTDMPLAQKINNVYRSRLIGNYYQRKGLTVIPTVQWADEDTFDFCFDGIEPGGVVAVSNVGCKQEKEAHRIFLLGMDEMCKRINPSCILLYGSDTDYEFQTEHVLFRHDFSKWRDENGKQRK